MLGLATGTTPETGLFPARRTSPRGLALISRRDDLQPRRVLPDQPARSQELPCVHAPSLVQPGGHRSASRHVLDGTVPEAFAAAHAAEFDRWIEADGGLDMQLLGSDATAISHSTSRADLSVDEALRLPTRLVELHPVTRADAAKEFGGLDLVIPRALTMGVASILAARSIVILATGARKAEIVRLRHHRSDDSRAARLTIAIGRREGHLGHR